MSEINSSAGDVIIEEAYITSKISGTTDIKNFIMEFEVYLDVFSDSMTSYFQISDAIGLITAIPLVGQESMTVKFKTPNIDESFYRTFIVHSITNRSLVRDREQRYTLECISPEAYVNTASVLTTKYKGSTDSIAAQIFNDIKSPRIDLPSGKATPFSEMEIPDVPHSSNNFEFIANFWSSFKCLNFLASRSRGATLGKTNVMFFERKDSYYFGSLESMVKSQKDANSIYDEYSKVESQEAPIYEDLRSGKYKYQSKYLNSRYHTIKAMRYEKFKSLLLNNLKGFHSQSIDAYDFVTKTLLTMKYDNRPESEQIAQNDRKYINEKFEDFTVMGEYNTISDNVLSDPLSVKRFTPMATSPYASSYSRGVQQVRNELIRNYSMTELDNNIIEITVPGKSDVDLGLLVRLVFPKTEEKTSDPDRDELEDPYVSGLYMIVGIRHRIQPNNHEMVLRLMRDSLGG